MKSLNGIMAKGWLTAIPLLFAQLIFGQPVRFSGFYDLNNGAGGLLSVVQLGHDTLLAVGSSLNLSTNSGYSEGHHVVVDVDGNLIYQFQSSEQHKSHKPQSVIRSAYSNSIFSAGYFCDYTVESPGYCDFYFSRLDGTGDTVFTKIIERPDTSDFLLSMVETRPNNIMLIGWTYNDTVDGNADILLITVDTLGNVVNRIVYGGGGTDYVRAARVIDDSGHLLLTGYTGSFFGADNDTWLIKTDSIGNIVWQRTYNHLSPNGADAGSAIIRLSDNEFILAGGFEQPSGESDSYTMLVDSLGNDQWTERYEIPLDQGIWWGELTSAGNLLFVGQTTLTDDGSQAGWLLEANTEGDTIWTRTYNPSDATDLLRNMLVMPNGDIVMVGFGRGENSTTQDGWILRVDSMGCEVENCFLIGIDDRTIDDERFAIFPNPASDVVRFNVQRSKFNVAFIQATDVLGRDCFSRSSFAMTDVMDVSSWPEGVYLITVTDEDGNRHAERLVVQH